MTMDDRATKWCQEKCEFTFGPTKRPRLSLSCHGDKSDANLVFKAVKATLQKPSAAVKKAVKAMLKGDASPSLTKRLGRLLSKNTK